MKNISNKNDKYTQQNQHVWNVRTLQVLWKNKIVNSGLKNQVLKITDVTLTFFALER